MIKKILAYTFITLLFTQHLQAQVTEGTSPIRWYTLEQAMALNKKEPRILMIDFYTDWCGWCKHMMNTTFTNATIANYINSRFYPVRFDAETRDTVAFLGEKYVNKSSGAKPPHDLAVKMLDGRLSYPSLVFFMKDSTKQVVPGYLDVKQFEPLMYYFGEEVFTSANFDEWQQYFTLTYKPDEVKDKNVDSITSGKIQWRTFEEVVELQKTAPRKILVDVYTNIYIGCNMMERTTYTNPFVADYINKYYYAIRFDALSKDTATFFAAMPQKGGALRQYPNLQNNGAYSIHTLAENFLQGKFVFPTYWYFDENWRVINRMTGYLPPENLAPIIQYFGDNAYLQQPWTEYRSKYKSKL